MTIKWPDKINLDVYKKRIEIDDLRFRAAEPGLLKLLYEDDTWGNAAGTAIESSIIIRTTHGEVCVSYQANCKTCGSSCNGHSYVPLYLLQGGAETYWFLTLCAQVSRNYVWGRSGGCICKNPESEK